MTNQTPSRPDLIRLGWAYFLLRHIWKRSGNTSNIENRGIRNGGDSRMKLRHKEIGGALGLLAGTTMGSGIGFLLGWHSYDLIVLVALFGFFGIAAGRWAGSRIVFKELP